MWGVDERANVVMPHYDEAYRLTGAKMRSPDGQRWSFPGSSYDNLYGCWERPPASAWRLLLVEGETDYAHARHHLWADRDTHVLSLPSGAGRKPPRPEWVPTLLSFRELVFAFDGDRAGRDAADTWAGYLLQSDEPPEMWQCPIDEGHDLRSCGRHPTELMNHARRIGP